MTPVTDPTDPTDRTDPADATDPTDPTVPTVATMTVARAGELDRAVLDEVDRAVVGKREALTLVLAGVLAGGHVLMEDFPGLGKTLAARSFAQALGLHFTRAQFTPDLLPGDITGSFVYDQRVGDFEFREGPIFAGLLLADEINRTPPKTQSALLEAMQEKQVTVEGRTFALPRPFHVLATANPVEYEGTYPLPEAQLDRFLMRVSFGYPSLEQEWQILARRMERQHEEQQLNAVVGPDELLAMQAAIEATVVDESIGRYCVALTAATRSHGDVLMGASPRGALGLLLCARAYAVIDDRDYVTPEDVKAVAPAVLAHRITVKPELWMGNVNGAAVVSGILRTVDTPSAREGSSTGLRDNRTGPSGSNTAPTIPAPGGGSR
ncbi:MAG: ATPase associated with various cellular 3 [Humibacillus sp.]|nr:ATPase associated with various cellular 3 [Humibacillus sp.]